MRTRCPLTIEERGTALVLTLSAMVLVTILIIAFITSMRTELVSSRAIETTQRTKMVAQGALSHAIESIVPSADHAMHRVHGLLARDLAGCVPAHPVRYDVEAQIVVYKERVLVQLSALPDVGQSRTVILQLVPFSSGGRRPALALSD